MINSIKRFLKNEDGAETLEYVVIVAIIVTLGSAAYVLGFGQIFPAVWAKLILAMTV